MLPFINPINHRFILYASEKKAGFASVINVHSKKGEVYIPLGKTTNKTYYFDNAFQQDTLQTEVYQKTTAPLINEIMKGYNADLWRDAPHSR